MIDDKAQERFWSKVDRSAGPDECWLWTGAVGGSSNYGQFFIKGKTRQASHVVWEIKNCVPFSGEVAMHICDNPPCVNPSHIVSSTQYRNMQDCLEKGRRHGGIGSLTMCPEGHDMSMPGGRRKRSANRDGVGSCAECNRIKSREGQARRRNLERQAIEKGQG